MTGVNTSKVILWYPFDVPAGNITFNSEIFNSTFYHFITKYYTLSAYRFGKKIVLYPIWESDKKGQ